MNYDQAHRYKLYTEQRGDIDNMPVITEDCIEVYENNIELYLEKYINERNISNMNKETQSRWNAALLYIKKFKLRT